MPIYELPKLYHPDFADPRVKPQGPVEVDWSNSLTRDLWFVAPIIKGANVYDLISTDFMVETGGTALEVLPQGTRNPGTSDLGNFLTITAAKNPKGLLAVDDFTITFDQITHDHTGIIANYFGYGDFALPQSSSNAGGSRWCTQHNGNWHFWPVTGDWATGIAVEENIRQVVSFTKRANSIFLHINGVQVATDTLTTLANMSGDINVSIGSSHSGATEQVEFDLFFGSIHGRGLSNAELKSYHANLCQILKPQIPASYFVSGVAAASAAITGTMTATVDEDDITTGGKTIIITLTGDTFKAAGTGPIGSTADTQALIDGFDAASSPTNGWNNEVRDKALTSEVVRTSSTIATWTVLAQAGYDISAQETITGTIPTDVLVTGAGAITGVPTFTIDAVSGIQPTQFYNLLMAN